MDPATFPLHIAMYPWFAMGHLTPFLHLANKLAKRGHKISFIIPTKTQPKLHHLNLHPSLITFVPVTVPHVYGLPNDAETTSDVPSSLFPLLATAMDLTKNDIKLILLQLKPHIVFFDFSTYWIPSLTSKYGIKSFQYWIISPATIAYMASPLREREVDMKKPPSGFPDSFIKLHPHEVRFFDAARRLEFGNGVLLYDRISTGARLSDAIGFKGCKEIEGSYVDYLETQLGKTVLLSGPLIPEPCASTLDEKWAKWLDKFKRGSVIYCAFGSENTLQKNQFEELLLGLELTRTPFLAALKPPKEFDSIEEALPKGFKERVKERGIVYGGWVQQQLILAHPSVGCFITHCGGASLTEALVSQCQLVLLPRLGSDFIINARNMAGKLKVGVEVEKGEEDGLFTKESVCEAVRIVMDDESEIGKEVRANHTKVRNLLLGNNFESSCVDNFCHNLLNLL
ncbi:putative anthocyanidin 3-O-glucoside 2''-O-glucosyltransferase [Lupinus albus]|uniref:Putative anthocyanidin 3-O-glucoside 2''-O-glucosyltransferase n=1 Tax=Lupinus albus TaxID=3870 RepID=A0A6A4R5A5_LUPAL|nr:putative anthocyanidin 3-O-glucoside 2''-O-glucosyltransferase [Lupinus albus]WMX26835.1 UGT79B182 [Lupinus albus]